MWILRWLSKIKAMNITFTLKNNSIYYRFRDGRKLSVIRKLPFKSIPDKEWSVTKQRVKPKGLQPINIKLAEFKTFLLTEYNITTIKNISIDLEWVKFKQHEFFNTRENEEQFKIFLYTYLEYFIKTEKPAKKYTTLKNHIPKSTKIINVDYKWLDKFSKNQLKKGYSANTTAKHVQYIKRVLKYAEYNHEVKINHSIFDFRSKKQPTTSVYLTPEEINLIFEYEYQTESLNNVKRLFLTGLTTGLRVSDLMRIKEFTIKDGFIELTAKKTKQPLLIPIDPRVKDFITNLRPISHPKFNKYIKNLCKIVGINEQLSGSVQGKDNKLKKGIYPKYKLITSHVMRRSFATNLYGKLPTMVIMAITGHTTEKSFLTYIKKPQRDFAEQLEQYYNENIKS